MKKIAFILIVFLIVFSSKQLFSQELPVISPQSPNAFQFTKHGEVNVNESTGAISPSIPLYSYKAGNIEIPIVLSYSGNAVKVAQDPTWVGINWNMMPGGVITRQVRDLQDEGSEGYSGNTKESYSLEQLNNLEGYGVYTGSDEFTYFGESGTDWHQALSRIGDPTTLVDSETDIFNYNFLGYSGSFYLNENNTEGILLNYNKELKIVFQKESGNKSIIFITTPDGNIYSFGGLTASESSKTYVESTPGSTSLGNDISQNAFYLHKIEPYTGGEVNFIFEQVNSNYAHYIIDTSESLSKRMSTGFCGSAPTYTYNPQRYIKLNTQSLLKLTRIESSFDNSKVEFSSTLLGDRRNKLNNIIIKDNEGNIHKKISFEYDTPEIEADFSDNKFFLEDVIFLDKNLNSVNQYHLKYNSLDLLPRKTSFARDYNGYYNDVNTNSTLLPEDSRFQGTVSLANRETDTTTIKYGSLNKITYPTGGYSIFDYECPIRGYEDAPYTERTDISVYQNNPYDWTNQYTKALGYIQEPYNLTSGQTVNVTLNTSASGDFNDRHIIKVYAIVYQNGVSQTFLIDNNGRPLTNSNNTIENYSDNYSFSITVSGVYTFFLEYENDNGNTSSNHPVFATAYFDIPNNTTTPTYYPSLRIKRITSKSDQASNPIIKRYYYASVANIDNTDVSTLIASPKFVNNTAQHRSDCTDAIVYMNLSANALNNMYSDDSQKILYPLVTTSYGGDDFQLGAKQSTFRVYPQELASLYFNSQSTHGVTLDVPFSYTTSGYSDGNTLLLNEKYFSKTDVRPYLTLLKETAYIYNDLSLIPIKTNIKAAQVSSGGYPYDIRKYNFKLYNIYSKKNSLSSIITKEYKENSINPVITTQNFEYDQYVGMPTKTITTTSNSDVTFQTENTYIDSAYESATNDYLGDLLASHRIGTPIQSVSYKEDNGASQLLSANKTIYANFSGNTLPQSIQTLKGNSFISTLEDRIIYHDYDDIGNPLEVSKADGTHIAYIWGYNQTVPIAKIENATYSQVRNYVSDLQGLSNDDNDRTIDIINTDGSINFQGNEGLLREGLNNLRTAGCSPQHRAEGTCLEDALITTYTYDPLIGVTSMTDPRGNVVYYHYDKFNRLEHVKDKGNNILSKNNYYYKN